MTAQNLSNQPATEKLGGAVERVTFHSEESGFCVLRVRVRGQRDLVTVIGTAATVSPGEYLECEGWWVNDRTHGLQFKTNHLRVVPPRTLEGIEKISWFWNGQRYRPPFCRKTGESLRGTGFRCHRAGTRSSHHA